MCCTRKEDMSCRQSACRTRLVSCHSSLQSCTKLVFSDCWLSTHVEIHGTSLRNSQVSPRDTPVNCKKPRDLQTSRKVVRKPNRNLRVAHREGAQFRHTGSLRETPMHNHRALSGYFRFLFSLRWLSKLTQVGYIYSIAICPQRFSVPQNNNNMRKVVGHQSRNQRLPSSVMKTNLKINSIMFDKYLLCIRVYVYCTKHVPEHHL